MKIRMTFGERKAMGSSFSGRLRAARSVDGDEEKQEEEEEEEDEEEEEEEGEDEDDERKGWSD